MKRVRENSQLCYVYDFGLVRNSFSKWVYWSEVHNQEKFLDFLFDLHDKITRDKAT